MSKAMGAERLSSSTATTKSPLHNFDIPWLKWGSQKHLRCIKPSDSSDRHRKVRSSPFTAAAELRKPKKQKQEGGYIEGIRAVGEKVICDLKAEADKMKEEILMKEGLMIREEKMKAKIVRENEEISDRADQSSPPGSSQSPSTGVGGGGGESGTEMMKPWNLRTRKASKPLVKVSGNGNSVKAINGHQSPVREKQKEKERAKFSVSLMKKEIEEDFMTMVNHRPARRPKKRPRAVQKELDFLFPALFLTEVTPDSYDHKK